jgi:uncharacterized protein
MKNSNAILRTQIRKTALITGASTGLGKFLALECAKRDFNLILVALVDTGLDAVKSILIDTYHVKVHIIETDLSVESNIRSIKSYCVDNNIKIDFLINNAGLGFEAKFSTLTFDFCSKLLDVNIKATVLLTKLFLNDLKQQKGFLLNVSSLASFAPIPYKSIYAASKSFIRSFGTALRSELVDTGIKITTLCPGPISTNDIMRQRIQSHGTISRIAAFESSEIAILAIRKSLDKGVTIVPGIINKFNMLLMRTFPEKIQQFLLRTFYSTSMEQINKEYPEKLKAA